MDKTQAILLSSLPGDELTVPIDPKVAVDKAFGHIATSNPLHQLDLESRMYLWALLLVYASSEPPRARKGTGAYEPLEALSNLVADAAKLGKGLKTELFGGPFADVLLPFTTGFEDLPIQLAALSKVLGNAVDAVGKRGHQHKTLANQLLIEASEFVRLKTGQHYDEHMAELFQAIAEGRRSLSEDLSGDAIRKKRDYMAKNYPLLHSEALKRAKKCANSGT